MPLTSSIITIIITVIIILIFPHHTVTHFGKTQSNHMFSLLLLVLLRKGLTV